MFNNINYTKCDVFDEVIICYANSLTFTKNSAVHINYSCENSNKPVKFKFVLKTMAWYNIL